MTSCFVCERSFKHLDNLEKHFEKQHPDEERICVRCNKSKNGIENDMIYQDICKRCITKNQCDKCKKCFRKKYYEQHDCKVKKFKDERFYNQCKITKALNEFYVSKY